MQKIPFDHFFSVNDFYSGRRLTISPHTFHISAIHSFNSENYDWIMENTTGRFAIEKQLRLLENPSVTVSFEDKLELALYTLRFI